MKIWDVLLQQSVLGLQNNSVSLKSDNEELNTALEALANSDNQERVFLRSAALVNSYRKAGEKLANISSLPKPTQAKEESLTECSKASSLRLRRLLTDNKQEVIIKEWCQLAVMYQKRVSYDLLPLLLQAGRKNRDLRSSMIKVIGERGLWLAAQNKDWEYACGCADNATEEDWELLPEQQRVVYLQELRKSNATLAREKLQACWQQEAAKQRLSLLEAVAVGLSNEDIEFLEQVVQSDKAKSVRKLAGEFLMLLPDSAITQKIQAEGLSYIVKQEKRGLLGGTKKSLVLQLPESFNNEWAALGLEEKPPAQHKKIGQKAWWLEQLLVWVPPKVWYQHFEANATELIELAKQSEWTELLISVWQKLCVLHQDVELAKGLFKHFNVFQAKNPRYDLAEGVFNVLPMETRQKLIIESLSSFQGFEDYSIICQWELDWDKNLSETVLYQLNHKTPKSQRYYNYAAQQALNALAMRLDLSCFETLSQTPSLIKKLEDENSEWQNFYQTYQFRYQMQQEFINE